MSYISDYEHGGDQFEYEQCCAEENNRDRIDQEEEWNEEREECCSKCKYLYPLKKFTQGDWEYSHVCLLFPFTEEKDDICHAMVIEHPDDGMCEMFKEEV